MRVLLAARHAPNGSQPIGGVQTWCLTVATELIRRGNEVVLWQRGMPLPGVFDAGIFANIKDTRPALLKCRRTISICHGIIEPERPPLHDVAFTSEEVRDYWKTEGPIIRQPVDLEFWQPADVKKNLLVRFSYRGGLDYIEDIALSMGLRYVHVSDNNQDQVREILQQAACVVATGRAAVETMACDVPVVICDDRPYQGPLLDNDTLSAMTRNYSGRGGVTPNPANVSEAINAAIRNGGHRSHTEAHHDVRNVVDQLLCLLS